MSLLNISIPAAPQTIAESISGITQNVLIAFKLNDWFSFLSWKSANIPKQETQEERDARVARIEIDSSGEIFITGKQIPLLAVAYDSSDNPVSGVNFEWEVENSKAEREEIVDNVFTAKTEGEFTVKVRGAGKESVTTFLIKSPADGLIFNSKSREFVRQYDEWDGENIPEARHIKNLRGNNPGKPKGKNNFNVSAPVFSMGGRGLNLDLNLYYNSLVWSKLDQDVSYDMDKDWLAPGWNLGFGKIINMIGGGIAQVDADGTRRFYSGQVTTTPDMVSVEGQSTDGTFIKAKTETSGFNTPNGPCYYNPTTYLKYPDGTTVWYDVFEYRGCYLATEPITMVPKKIQDRNGNQINISYHNPVNNPPGRWINQISDTLGRIYTFNYTLDSGKYYLTDITGLGLPDENNVPVPRTFVRLQYKNHAVGHNFSGLTAHVRAANIKVLSAIYYPSTQSGYWFGETDAYSPYGMIRKVSEHKNMSYSSGTGITAGQLTRQRIYSYPTDTNTPLTDIPTFSSVTETWEGMTTAAPVTEYQVNWDTTPRTTTIIAPDQSKIVETSYNLSSLLDTDPEKAKDGITYKTEYFNTANQLSAKDEIDWEPGYQVSASANSKIIRPKNITHNEYENGITFTTSTVNDVFGEYNQVLEMREIGYGGTNDVLRKTVAEFTKKGDSPATGDDWRARPRLINLPAIVQIYDNSNARISYVKYEYDLNALQALSGSNPPNFCTDSFCNSITDRGNPSKTTVYENAANLSGAFSNNLVYDKVGNLVEYKPEITGNSLNIFTYTYQTRYAFPEEIKNGSTDPNLSNLIVKNTATYNYETGLPLTITDPDLQQGTFEYNLQNWRRLKTILPTGGYSTVSYDDANLTYTQSSFTSGNALVGKQLSKINGLGLPYRQESYTKTEQGQDIWDVVEIEYDQLARAKKKSNPFRSNESAHGVYWTEAFYDSMGRTWKTVGPDGNTKFNYFNETPRPQGASTETGKTFRTKDATGREKWFRTDSDGNVAEVIEPNPDGSGAVSTNGLLTKYTYDRLSHLTQTEQGSQIRKFKYDSLGRLTNQKMAEAKATLNDGGTFVGEGNGVWSDFYAYDKFSNVTSSKDARGVSATYSYANPALPQFPIDPLNRIFSVSYNTNGAADVLASPTVNFEYQSTGNVSQLKSVTTQGVSTVELGYDTRGRVNEQKTTILSRPAYPMITNYAYDSLNRVTDVIYPTQYGTSGSRKTVHSDFDTAGRMNGLKVDNVNYASDFVFNNFDQVTSIKIGPSGANQITETYNYNAQTALLENQKVLKSGVSLLDLSYQYQLCGCSSSGTGQITKITNNLDRNKDRAYDYDALSRLKKVTGGLNQTWSQTYVYDRYGNRTSVTPSGMEALRNENAQLGNTDKQNDVLKESLSMPSVPTGKKLLSDIANLTNVKDSGNTSESPISLYNESDGAAQTGEQQSEKMKAQENNTTSSAMPPAKTPFDFDYDGKADFSIFQRSAGDWTVYKSGNNQTTTTHFGTSGDQIAPGDYDNDGKTDYAVWRPSTGVWYISRSSDGVMVTQAWGVRGDSIVPADYDGDGKTDIAVWRPSTSIWYILRSTDGGWNEIPFGNQTFGDIPVPADYDGDGKADVSIWRPSTGLWYIQQSSNGVVITPQFGVSGDIPVQAKYDADNKADFAVWRPSTGVWYIYQSSNGQVLTPQFGGLQFGDIPVPADYDGDGKADIAVWRQPTTTWYVARSSDAGYTIYQLGATADLAVPSAYRRRSSAPNNQNKEIPRDGLTNLTYEAASNRITNSGFIYDSAGNQTQVVKENGTILKFKYDAAGRMVKVKNNNDQTLVTYTYGESRKRLITQEGDENSTNRTYYAWEAGAVISEYFDSVSNALVWTKNYIYMGGALLAMQEQIAGSERLRFDHPDQLGTRLITDPGSGTSFEQNTLPFGTALESESTGSINQRFTSYDRSASTGLDYATNRFYDSSQGRFTQADPINMGATSLTNPQTLNLFAYTANDPVNHTDPDGLDWNIDFGHTGGFPHPPGGGTSLPAGWIRFFQGIFGTLFGNGYSLAGMIVRASFQTVQYISATQRYGLPNAGQTSMVAAPVTLLGDCDEKLLTEMLVKDDSSDGAVTKFPFISSDIVSDFNKAMREINDTFGNIGFTEMFRTYDWQKELKRKDTANEKAVAAGKKKPYPNVIDAASAGTSNHEAGYSFDIPSRYLNLTKNGTTIEKILNKYGFFKNVPGDRVHFTHKNANGKDIVELNKKMNKYYTDCIQEGVAAGAGMIGQPVN